MATPKKRLGELLISLRILNQEQLDRAFAAQKQQDIPLGEACVRLGFLTEELLLNALAAQIGVWPWRLEQNPPDPKAVAKVDGELCRLYEILPVALRGDLLLLAMVNPHDMAAIEAVRNTTGLRIEPVLADASRLMKAIDKAHQTGRRNAEDMDKLVDAALKDFRIEDRSRDNINQLTEADTRPVVELVNQILTDAIRARASDVHIEPHQDRIEIRYRIDGQMEVARVLPIGLLPMLTTRLKIMSEIDIVEYRVPQDGRVSAEVDGRSVDLRVSVLPNYHGSRIVLRILDKTLSLKGLDEIGFSRENLSMFRSIVSKPHGMFLVTGPTGSGKTTTLYASLQEIKHAANNVMTCEDPVEYEIDGVNQSQVNEKVGLTFARQLRAILRQDPDVILVGEIRDGETAETAIRAALTGHMVLSTLHCNDAPSALPRLIDMGVDPYLLSTSLVGVMAQRLVRMLCPECRRPYAPTEAECDLYRAFGEPVPDALYGPGSCPSCLGTGYRGRMAVEEILPVTPEVASVIAAHEPIATIRNAALRYGYVPMQHSALRAIAHGTTSLAEAQRVVFLDATYAEPLERRNPLKV